MFWNKRDPLFKAVLDKALLFFEHAEKDRNHYPLVHAVFYSHQTFGDCILEVDSPIDTEEAVHSIKQTIKDKFELDREPVLISWRKLRS